MYEWQPKIERQPTLVRPVRLDPSGSAGPTRGQAAGPRWRRSSHGFYVPAHVDPDVVEQRILEQSMLLPPRGAVTGWAALRLHGAAFFDGLLFPVGSARPTRLPVPLAVGSASMRRHPGVQLSRRMLDPSEVETIGGVPCCSEERALIDELRRVSDLRDRVVALDMAFAGEVTSRSRMRRALARERGAAPLVHALEHASEHSRSPQETRLRLIWTLDAGWPRPRVNVPVLRQSGALIGTPDLVDPDMGLLAEYDGLNHRSKERHRIDVRREAGFRGVGLECAPFVGDDLTDVRRVVARLEETRQRAGSQPRRWRMGERPGPTLDERLDWRDATRAAPIRVDGHENHLPPLPRGAFRVQRSTEVS